MKTSTKTSALSVAALLTLGVIATPVLAGDSAGFDSGIYVQQLRYDGINAVDADYYANNLVRVTVRLTDGTEVFQFFDKDSYAPVNYGR